MWPRLHAMRADKGRMASHSTAPLFSLHLLFKIICIVVGWGREVIASDFQAHTLIKLPLPPGRSLHTGTAFGELIAAATRGSCH